MSAYVRPQSAGEILRNSAHLYRKNFRALFLTYLIPLLPVSIVYVIAYESGSPALLYTTLALLLLAFGFAVIPVTVVLSDICLGNEPGIRRAFRRAFDRSAGQVMGTYLLSTAVTILGLLLCIVPGVVFTIWYLFALIVVVLERVGGWTALRRSKELGQGFFLRNFGVLLLCYALIFAGSLFIWMILILVGMITGPHMMIAQIVAQIFNLLLNPILVIATVLMYYDMRSRKEAYDSAALAEDLRR
ncbi:MAG TPA: hypothetical protein VGG03_03350 [Thermoanaerobaculia bacterium]|jgi:uncharacterized membrane protein